MKISLGHLLWVFCAFMPTHAVSGEPGASGLIGSWMQRVKIMGSMHGALVTYRADGSFREVTFLTTSGWTERDLLVPMQLPREGGQSGHWKLSGQRLILTDVAGPMADSRAGTRVRTVVRLTANEFVSADEEFGIEIERRRVPDPVYIEVPKK